LSRELATRWDWRNGAGQLKDMAARTLLGKLEQRGLIGLPPRRQVPTNRMRCVGQGAGEPEWDQGRIDCDLAQLDGLTVKEVSTQSGGRAWVRAALRRFHYLGFGGALLHVLNHSLFKSLLFYSAGSVYQQTHTRDMDQLGGLIKQMPKTAVLFLIGAIAIGGLPPFNGFVSEFVLYSGLLEGLKSSDLSQISLLVFTLAGLSIIGGISILTFTKTFGTIFLGTERDTLKHQPEEVSVNMLLPQYFIVAVMLSVAFLPQIYLNVIGSLLGNLGISQVFAGHAGFSAYSNSIVHINLYFILFAAIVAASWFVRSMVIKGKSSEIQPTWGCAYIAPTPKLQYTGKSFSKSLGKMFGFLLTEEKKYKELKEGEIFPERRTYVSHYLDFFENRFIKSITHHLVYAVNYFKFIQNGRVQSYVLYGIVFMLAIFILTVLNVLK